MKNKDFVAEQLSDVKNIDEHTLPGQYTSLDLGLLYPGGMP